MLETILLDKERFSPDILLQGLGKINVFTGPNSSGKSTLLNALSTNMYFIGAHISLDQFVGHYEKKVRSKLENIFLNSSALRNILSDILTNKIWYLFEKDEFISRLNDYFNSTPEFMSDKQNFINGEFGFSKYFQLPPPSIFLKTKSYLSGQDALEALKLKDFIDDRGSHYLKYLFTLKMKKSDSKERETFQKIEKAFREISEGYEFEVSLDENDTQKVQLYFCFKGMALKRADQFGYGLRDLLVIITACFTIDIGLLLIEEPEDNLHPKLQRNLLKFFTSVENIQFFLSTHSNVFLDTSLVNKIFLLNYNDHIVVSDNTDKSTIMRSLGYSYIDNVLSDLIILVEGPDDVLNFQELFNKFDYLQKSDIKFWPVGGDIMGKNEIDLSVFKENKNVIAIIDLDPGSKSARDRFKEKCDSNNIKWYQLERYSLENYFTISAIKAVYPEEKVEVKKILPKAKIINQLGFNPKKYGWKIFQIMSIDDIDGTDLMDILRDIEIKVKNIKGITTTT